MYRTNSFKHDSALTEWTENHGAVQPSMSCYRGASSGIGRATCQVLTEKGAKVIGSGRNEAALKSLQAEGGCFEYVVTDMTADGESGRLVERAVSLLGGKLTTVVHAAGVLKGGAMGEVDLSNYHFQLPGTF